MGRRLPRTTITVLTGACILGGILLGLHLALRRPPGFYRAALAMAKPEQEAAGRDFERNVLALHNDIQQHGRWEHVFSEEQINGWLAVDLPEKFPELLPPTMRDPRVELSSRQVQVAFHYRGERFESVISLTLEVQVADLPNTLAVRIRQARAGWIPIPLKDFLDQVSEAARLADFELRWAQRDGDPVALFALPQDGEGATTGGVTLETIDIRPGEVLIGGRGN